MDLDTDERGALRFALCSRCFEFMRPKVVQLPDAVIDKMVERDIAHWVDKPGVNDYTLHDAYYSYGMTTELIKPPHQDVFPRSYQYDLDCVKYRRRYKPKDESGTSQLEKRWRYYPDVTAKRSVEEIQKLMNEVGRPFHHEVCNWYYMNYPSKKYNCILRKFSR